MSDSLHAIYGLEAGVLAVGYLMELENFAPDATKGECIRPPCST
jgi:hypothetical protein